jgi:hypothetical protein
MSENAEPTGPFAAFQKMLRETPDWPHWEMLSAFGLGRVIASHSPRLSVGKTFWTRTALR